MAPTAAQVYVEQMFKRKHGKPLWFPEVCEVYVGDVGFFERETGNFCRLFNVLVGNDDPLNAQGVPDEFKPLLIKPRYVTYAPQTWKFGQCLRTSTVTASELEFKPLESDTLPVSAGISFKCSKKLGALLLLRNQTPRVDMVRTRAIEEYIEDNIDSWYTFAWRDFTSEVVPEGSIVLVRGCNMSDSWALASFTDRSQEGSLFFNGGIYSGAGSMKIRGKWSRATASSAEVREGQVLKPNEVSTLSTPDDTPEPGHCRVRHGATSSIWRILGVDSHPEFETLKTSLDCVFIRTYRIRRPFWGLPLRIKAQAGPHRLPSRSASNESIAHLSALSSTLNEDPVLTETRTEFDMSHHPLDYLLEYIFETLPEAQLAIVTDDDLYHLLPNEADFDDIKTALRARSPELQLDSRMMASVKVTLNPTIPDPSHRMDFTISRRMFLDMGKTFEGVWQLMRQGEEIGTELYKCLNYMGSNDTVAKEMAQHICDLRHITIDAILAASPPEIPVGLVEASMKRFLEVSEEILLVFKPKKPQEFSETTEQTLDHTKDMHVLTGLKTRLETASELLKLSIAGYALDEASLESLKAVPAPPVVEVADHLESSLASSSRSNGFFSRFFSWT